MVNAGPPIREIVEQLKAHRRWLIEAEFQSYAIYDRSLLALSGGGLGISLILLKDLVSTPVEGSLSLLVGGWLSFVLSILVTVISLATSQAALRREIQQIDGALRGGAYPRGARGLSSATRWLTVASGVFFLVGAVALTGFATWNLGRFERTMEWPNTSGLDGSPHDLLEGGREKRGYPPPPPPPPPNKPESDRPPEQPPKKSR